MVFGEKEWINQFLIPAKEDQSTTVIVKLLVKPAQFRKKFNDCAFNLCMNMTLEYKVLFQYFG